MAGRHVFGKIRIRRRNDHGVERFASKRRAGKLKGVHDEKILKKRKRRPERTAFVMKFRRASEKLSYNDRHGKTDVIVAFGVFADVQAHDTPARISNFVDRGRNAKIGAGKGHFLDALQNRHGFFGRATCFRSVRRVNERVVFAARRVFARRRVGAADDVARVVARPRRAPRKEKSSEDSPPKGARNTDRAQAPRKKRCGHDTQCKTRR